MVTDSFGNLFSQWEAQHALMMGPVFFTACSFESPQVPKLFLKAFPMAPPFLSHIDLPKVQLVYKLKRSPIEEEYTCFNFATEGPKRHFHWGGVSK